MCAGSVIRDATIFRTDRLIAHHFAFPMAMKGGSAQQKLHGMKIQNHTE